MRDSRHDPLHHPIPDQPAAATVSLHGHHIASLDTTVLIYALERHPQFGDPARRVLDAIATGHIRGTLSTIALAELLVLPYRSGHDDSARRYVALLQSFPNLTIVAPDVSICQTAAYLRASERSLRLPDALHLATTREAGATVFVTNDRRLPPLPDIHMLLLRDLSVTARGLSAL